MERDLILGYVAIKLTSFLAMALHARDEPAGALWIALCVAGFAGGAFLLASAWRKARALTHDSPAETPAVAPEQAPMLAPARPKAEAEPVPRRVLEPA